MHPIVDQQMNSVPYQRFRCHKQANMYKIEMDSGIYQISIPSPPQDLTGYLADERGSELHGLAIHQIGGVL